jgi:peptidoglycan/LPS O-acetylase OafA/YrhL
MSPSPSNTEGNVVPADSRIPALDGLRGCACLLVFIGHFIASNEHMGPFFPRLFSQYWSGVDLFFVLSGFVIFHSLHRLQERAPSRVSFLGTYVSNRFFRLVPVYLILVLSYFLIPVAWPGLARDGLFLSSIPRWCYLCFAQSWWSVVHERAGAGYVNVTWSLCAEVLLYCVAFLVVRWVAPRGRIRVMLGLAAFSLLARAYFVFVARDNAAAYLLPICRMDGFMLGGTAALLHIGGRLPLRSTAALDGTLAVLALVYYLLIYNGDLWFSALSILFSYAFYSVFYSLVLIRVLGGDWVVLSRGPLAAFGVISYFVYLFQIPALSLTERYVLGGIARLASTVALLVAAASISWFLVERPLIRLGRTLDAARRARGA